MRAGLKRRRIEQAFQRPRSRTAAQRYEIAKVNRSVKRAPAEHYALVNGLGPRRLRGPRNGRRRRAARLGRKGNVRRRGRPERGNDKRPAERRLLEPGVGKGSEPQRKDGEQYRGASRLQRQRAPEPGPEFAFDPGAQDGRRRDRRGNERVERGAVD